MTLVHERLTELVSLELSSDAIRSVLPDKIVTKSPGACILSSFQLVAVVIFALPDQLLLQ